MDTLFLQALLNRPPEVLGRPLRDFSLSHSYFLRALENPYVCGGPCSQVDLFEAVYVCSQSHRENIDLVQTADERMEDLARWMGGFSDEEIQQASSEFEAYQIQYLGNVPQHWKGKDSRPYRTPWEWQIVRVLVANKIAVTDDQAWDTAINTARCWFAAIAEAEGDESYVTPEERAAFQALEERREAASNG